MGFCGMWEDGSRLRDWETGINGAGCCDQLRPICPQVLFTGVADARGERAVLALGGHLASSVAEASCLVTDRIRRTVKFLCALGRGIPILSLDWLYQVRGQEVKTDNREWSKETTHIAL